MKAAVVLVVAMALGACGDDSSPGDPTEAACAEWDDLLLEDPAPSDAEVASRLRAIDPEGVDPEIADTITALAARLEDGVDISTAYARLSDLCH